MCWAVNSVLHNTFNREREYRETSAEIELIYVRTYCPEASPWQSQITTHYLLSLESSQSWVLRDFPVWGLMIMNTHLLLVHPYLLHVPSDILILHFDFILVQISCNFPSRNTTFIRRTTLNIIRSMAFWIRWLKRNKHLQNVCIWCGHVSSNYRDFSKYTISFFTLRSFSVLNKICHKPPMAGN